MKRRDFLKKAGMTAAGALAEAGFAGTKLNAVLLRSLFPHYSSC